MRLIFGILASLLLSLFLTHTPIAGATAQPILDLRNVDFADGALVDLANFEWEVWPNELRAPSDLSSEGRRIRLDKAWTAVTGDNMLMRQQGMMTLRLRINLPPSSPPLVFGAGFTAPARLFIDGIDVGTNGRPGTIEEEQISSLRARIPLGDATQHEIVLHISYHQRGTAPDFLSRPVIGTPGAYTKRSMLVSNACIGLAAVLFVIGIIALTVGFKADLSGPFLWLSLLCFSAAARYAITARAHFFDLQDGFAGLFWFGPQPIFIPLSAIGQIATVMVIARLFPSEIMKRGRNVLIGLAISRPVLWFIYPNLSIVVFDWQLRDIGRLDRDYNFIIFAFWTYFFIWLTAICMRRIASGGPYGRMTLITLSAAFIVMIIENVTEAVYFSTSSSMLLELITGMVVMYVLVDQFGEARRSALALADDLQKINLGLEATVEQRTQSLRETQSQLVQAEKMASLGTLVAGVAHEINTPLGIAVTATSQLIRDADEIKETIAHGQLSRGKLDGFVKSIDLGLGISYSNLTRAANLVSSFKQVAVDQNSEQAREIDLADYIKDILRSLDPILKSAKVRVEQIVPAGIKLKTQPGALAQVVTNLVQNAIKHAFDGIAEPRLSFSVNIVSAAEIQLIMTDNGVGMDETIRARAFDPFFTTKRGAGGTGLGLHIVHNLMTEALKGRIELNSRSGHGTEFRLTLPV
jgi:signal transduction histidine kinase